MNMPAARINRNRAFMNQVRSGNSVRVSGYDLIYNTEEGIVQGPFCVVPCNPAYWTGTRISTVANSYSQFRPISMRFDYYPQVSTMNNGNVMVGTIWNNNTNTNNLQQTLATSNGGKIFPVYSSCRIPIKLQTNLAQNLFDFQGYLDSKTNPFMFIATTQQSNNIIPGYFMVSYCFEFKNPIGEGFEYDTEVKTAGSISKDDVWETTTGVLLTSTTAAAIGTKLILQVVDGAVQYFLGGSRVGLIADCILKLFKSRPKQVTKLNDNLEDLSESNTITQLNLKLEFEHSGSAVVQYFSIQEKLTLEHFKSWKTHISGAEYTKVGGLFAKLIEVGPGRYNIGLMCVSNTTETVPEDLYLLKTSTTPTDYSVMNTLGGNDYVYANSCTLHLQYQNYEPITCEIPTMDNFSSQQYYMLADIALLDAAQVLGINQKDVVGTGDIVLVPTNNNTVLLN
jgi:hypothetical protein